MGISKDIFTSPLCPDLMCSICLDVLDDPIQVRCPEDHIFCKQCIDDFVKTGKSDCPLCRAKLNPQLFQVSKFVRRQIGRLEVRCWLFEKGCDWNGPFSDNHQSNCPFKQIPCPNVVHGCAESPRRLDVPVHLETCLFELISCPNDAPTCPAFLRKFSDTHERTCRSYRCEYACEGCAFVGTRPEAVKHCDAYCRRLFVRIKELEVRCESLSRILEQERQDTGEQGGLDLGTLEEMEEMTGYVGRPKRFKVDDSREQVEQDGEDIIEKLLRESEADLPYDDNEDDTRSLSSLFPDRLDDNSEDEVMFIDNGQSMSQAHQTRVVEQSTPQKRPSKNNFRYPSSRSRAARARGLPSVHNDGARGTVDGPKNDASVNSSSKPDSLSTISLQPASSVVKPKAQWGGFFSPDSFQLSTTTTTTTTSLGVAYSPQNQKRRSSVAPSSSPSPSTSIRRGSKTHTPSEIPDSMIGSLTHIIKPSPQQQETPSADDDLFEEDDVIAIASPSLSRITGSFDTPGDDGPPDPPSGFGRVQGAALSAASSALTPPINGPTPQSELSELGDEDQVIGVAVSPAVPVQQQQQQQQQQYSRQQQPSRQQQQQPQHQQQSRHYPRGGGSTERAQIQTHPQSRHTQGHHAKGSAAAAPVVTSHAGGVPKRPMFVLASSYLGASKWAKNGSGGRGAERGGTTPRDGDGEDSVDSPIF